MPVVGRLIMLQHVDCLKENLYLFVSVESIPRGASSVKPLQCAASSSHPDPSPHPRGCGAPLSPLGRGGGPPLIPGSTYLQFTDPAMGLDTSPPPGYFSVTNQGPSKHINSFGSTGFLHRSNLEDSYGADVSYQNALNEGFFQKGSLGTSPRLQQQAQVSPRSATLPKNQPQSRVPNQFCSSGRGDVVNRNNPPCGNTPGWNPSRTGKINESVPGSGRLMDDSNCASPYSCADVSNVLRDSCTPLLLQQAVTNHRGPQINPANQRAPQITPTSRRPPVYDGNTAASSVVDANDLCNEIDELFFNNMRTSNCWNHKR